MMGDSEILHVVMEEYIKSVPIQIKELRDAIENNSQKDANRIAHSIKGASLNVGADIVAHLSKQLERRSKEKIDIAMLKDCDKIEEEFNKLVKVEQDTQY